MKTIIQTPKAPAPIGPYNQAILVDNTLYAKKLPIHFIGSISYFLREELEAKLISYGFTLGKILKKPIEGLVSYHQSTD